MNATLVVVGGKADLRQLEIRLPALLGRSRQADLTIAHSLISRKHCELREHEGVVLLTDLGSLNGTYFGDRKIRRVELMPNDQFTVGPLTFEIQYCPAATAVNQAGPGSVGLPVELLDPIEPTPVELDEAVQVSSPRGGQDQSVAAQNAVRRRTQVLPGFTVREDRLAPDEDGERCARQDGESIAIDPAHGNVRADSIVYDAPTSQAQLPQDVRKNAPDSSACEESEQGE